LLRRGWLLGVLCLLLLFVSEVPASRDIGFRRLGAVLLFFPGFFLSFLFLVDIIPRIVFVEECWSGLFFPLVADFGARELPEQIENIDALVLRFFLLVRESVLLDVGCENGRRSTDFIGLGRCRREAKGAHRGGVIVRTAGVHRSMAERREKRCAVGHVECESRPRKAVKPFLSVFTQIMCFASI
jgi:hypothetical protein